jgi:hypothetical protein
LFFTLLIASLFEVFESFLNYVFCISFLCLSPGGLLGHPGQSARAAKRERAGSAKVGPCLTDAAPKPPPASLFVCKPLREGPNVNLSGRCGMLFRWCHQHLSSTALDGRSASIQAGVTMIIPIRLPVNDCIAVGMINRVT